MIAASRPGVLTKLMIVGGALRWTARRSIASYEDVEFPAADGVGLSGWFIPRRRARGHGPAVVFAHGWLWNRLGNVAGQVPVPDKDVDFLPAARRAPRGRLPRAAVRPVQPRTAAAAGCRSPTA